jgi:hypothetical protein
MLEILTIAPPVPRSAIPLATTCIVNQQNDKFALLRSFSFSFAQIFIELSIGNLSNKIIIIHTQIKN